MCPHSLGLPHLIVDLLMGLPFLGGVLYWIKLRCSGFPTNSKKVELGPMGDARVNKPQSSKVRYLKTSLILMFFSASVFAKEPNYEVHCWDEKEEKYWFKAQFDTEQAASDYVDTLDNRDCQISQKGADD